MCHKTHCFLFYNLNLYPTPHDCFYILRFVGVHLDLFADLLDMHGNCCNISDGFHIPDFPEQFFLCKHMVWIFCQKGKKIKFFCCKLFFLVVHPDTACCLVNADTADLNDIIFLPHCFRSGAHIGRDVLSPALPAHLEKMVL